MRRAPRAEAVKRVSIPGACRIGSRATCHSPCAPASPAPPSAIASPLANQTGRSVSPPSTGAP